MHKPSEKFTVEVTGDGDLTGMFFTELSVRFPFAKVFDRTDSTNKTRRAEARLGKTLFASPEFRALASEIDANLKNPSRTDITVKFMKMGKNENVMVIDKQSSRILHFDLTATSSLTQVISFVQQIVQAVGQAH
ncbi:MAG: hypothetical protein ABI539_07575 [Acidobacteriota bacterium]